MPPPRNRARQPSRPLLSLSEDRRWLDAAARLAARGVPLSRPNPAVGAIIVKNGAVIARGWTQPGGRPHAEAIALSAAGDGARGATLYVSLEPCAHQSERGPACADLVSTSGLARVVVGCMDPDPRTSGAGVAQIESAGVAVTVQDNDSCRKSLAGYLTRNCLGRPHVTLKLALSEDLRLARPPGGVQWLTGDAARSHVHAQRARMDAILVGRGTLEADNPRLDVRLPGLNLRSPERFLLTRGDAPAGWRAVASPGAIHSMNGAQYLMVEGGAETARAFLDAHLVDRLMLYRAPVVAGGDALVLSELSAEALVAAGWHITDSRPLGSDRFEVYERNPCSPE